MNTPPGESTVLPGSLPVLITLLTLALVGSVVTAVGIGPVEVGWGTVLRIMLDKLPWIDPLVEPSWEASTQAIVWELRFPRVLLSVVVGAGLSVVGACLQALVRNPLADPYILGISSGASVGAALVIVFGLFSFLGPLALSTAACAGAFGTLLLVYLVGKEGNRVPVVRLLLAGIAMSAILSALTSFLLFLSPRESGVSEVYFWIMGSLSGATWGSIPLPALAVLGGTALVTVRARSLNLLLMGDETALSLGLRVSRFRKLLLLVSTVLTGVLVAVSGAIGFVGLMIPHVVRIIVGANHRRLIPVSALVGAVFLVWADVLARILLAPQELPIGILTALSGGPFFIWLLRRRDYDFGVQSP